MKTNIILIGMPGSGKTSIGKRLADKLGMEEKLALNLNLKN